MSKHSQSQDTADSSAKEKPESSQAAEEGEKIRENAVPGTPEPMSPEEELAALKEKIGDLETKLADANDQYLRKAADLDNFRKRAIREKQEISDFANQSLLKDLLPVLDDFERAMKFAESNSDFASFYEGIGMIEKRLYTQLENKWGLKRFYSEGEPFDPNRHEALQVEKAKGISEAIVKEDFLKGYLLKERVIRFAKVKVLMPADGESSGQSAEEERAADNG